MMNKQALSGMWDLMRQKHGITLRVLEAMPEDKFHTHPIANMRTPAELIAHFYGVIVRDLATGVLAGRVTADESAEKSVAAGLKTKKDMIAFAEDCWKKADTAVKAMSDEHLSAMVPTPWDMSLPGWMMMGITNDEYLHHRGQLYAYARVLGVEPPMMWDFENNAPAYRPTQKMQA
jgi:uncharacterized damage-inducible protein DinB